MEFAYCYRIYVRWRSHRGRRLVRFAQFKQAAAQALVERLGIHVLEAAADETDAMCLLSLQPAETVAAAVSKVKGQVSKWLREATANTAAERLLGRGYFAVSTGDSKGDTLERYLQSQSDHHGYDGRWARPPVLVESFSGSFDEESRLQADHSHTMLRLHLVFSTWQRRGVFSQTLAARTLATWQDLQEDHRFSLKKVSFVPDHVHLAMRIHPSVSPATLVCDLMNEAQDIVEPELRRRVKPPGVERLWQPSAYVGTYGDLASPQISAYLRGWRADDG